MALCLSQASGVVTLKPRMSTLKYQRLWPGSGMWFGQVHPLVLRDALGGLFEFQPSTGAEIKGNLCPLAHICNIPWLGPKP